MSSISQKQAVEQSFELLIKCMMQSKHRLVELGSDYELTAMQTMMLILLDAPKPMNSFTKVFNCDASNITGIVDGLEAKKLAARYPDKLDRRLKMIKLSTKGETLKKKLIGKLIDDESSILFNLSLNELNTLTSLLKKLMISSV